MLFTSEEISATYSSKKISCFFSERRIWAFFFINDKLHREWKCSMFRSANIYVFMYKCGTYIFTLIRNGLHFELPKIKYVILYIWRRHIKWEYGKADFLLLRSSQNDALNNIEIYSFADGLKETWMTLWHWSNQIRIYIKLLMKWSVVTIW